MLLDSSLEHFILYEKLLQQIRDFESEERRDEAEALMNAENQHTFSVDEGVMSEEDEACQIDSGSFVESVGSLGSERTMISDIGILTAFTRGYERPASSIRCKKRSNTEGTLICRSRATVRFSEYRREPDRPKALCNACGCKFIIMIVFSTS